MIIDSTLPIFTAATPSTAQVDSIAGGALGRGMDALMAEDYDKAIREFKRTIALSPSSDNAFTAYDYLATTQVKSLQPGEAEKTYKQAIKVFPSADGFHLNLGHLLFSQSRTDEAVQQYAAAVKLNPTESQNRYALGQGYLTLKRYDDAAAQFKEVIRLQPKDSGGYYALGQTYREAGKLDAAQEQLDKALALKNDFPYAHYERGLLYAEQQQITKAQDELAILSEAAPELVNDLRNKISEKSAPRFLNAYSTSLNLASAPGTKLSSLDSSLTTPGGEGDFTIKFIFDKEMDPASVQNAANWTISRSTSYQTGGLYNWGLEAPSTEVNIPIRPASVTYDSTILTAKVTVKIAQNSSGDGTIDLSHLVFKFSGTDSYGNVMDASADKYNAISTVV